MRALCGMICTGSAGRDAGRTVGAGDRLPHHHLRDADQGTVGSRSRAAQPPSSKRSRTPVNVAGCCPSRWASALGCVDPAAGDQVEAVAVRVVRQVQLGPLMVIGSPEQAHHPSPGTCKPPTVIDPPAPPPVAPDSPEPRPAGNPDSSRLKPGPTPARMGSRNGSQRVTRSTQRPVSAGRWSPLRNRTVDLLLTMAHGNQASTWHNAMWPADLGTHRAC
jgi:hypothetical protein